MPDFYAVPYPTSQDPGVLQPRRSRTAEYRHLVAEPCKAGKLSLSGYRWAAYLYGGESCVSLRTYATNGRYDSLLARRLGDCAAFRQSLHEEGYNGLPDRDVEYNIYVPHDLLPDFPIGRRVTDEEAQSLIRSYPIPRWIDRDSSLYRGWTLCPNTWTGQQSLQDCELTEDATDDRMISQPSTPTDNPPSPFSHGPVANPLDRGTPRNRSANMAPKDQPRNQRGQFARNDKDVSVTSKESTAVTFAAAALTHMAENPGLYSAEWSAGARTNKPAILSLASKLTSIAHDDHPQSPADVLRRLNLGPESLTTPSRKRQAMVNLVEDDSDEDRVYRSAPRFQAANPFATPGKKAAVPSKSDKADPAEIATTLENKEYFKSVATFMGKFGEVTNLTFDPDCPAMRDSLANRPPQRDAWIKVGPERIAATLFRDKYTTACLIPCPLVDGFLKAINAIRSADTDILTHQVPVCFILHALLRTNRDFGVVKIRYNEDNVMDKAATINAWLAKYQEAISPDYLSIVRRRIAGLADYVANHGVVKCHALTDSEVNLVASGVADDVVDSFWGLTGGASGAGTAADID
jgi:hypothetical protein